MEEYSILVGNSHRTPDGEVRVVKSVDHGEVEYEAGSGSRGPGMIARVSTKRAPLAHFAAAVEGEVSPAEPGAHAF
jgi:hypothetical protein